ncbi:MAG: hypothetical protein AB200_01760 [Parcubacteria bacterium C7867-005]|nr:MAG: hypothetical protein AB200_01760 [Parcubacteria bacterium C7867-005]
MNLEKIASIIAPLGFELDEEQPHMKGERFLMMKNKYVLSATTDKGNKVILKIAHHEDGKKEIMDEKLNRDVLTSVVFSNDRLMVPEEIYFGIKDGHLVWATAFIPQEKVFVAHSIEDQFFKILRVFEEQEAFHATTFEHLKSISKVFPVFHAKEYFEEFKKFANSVSKNIKDRNLDDLMSDAYELLVSNKKNIDEFSNYLTHTDFVPHNFRIRGNAIFMLDLSSVHFGNKYEGWARFMNYMVIHNPHLNKLLSEYVLKNRGVKEQLSLRLMRIYKIGFLLQFYGASLSKTEGDLQKLTMERISFWQTILEHLVNNEEVPESFVESYKDIRDNLRSKDEKDRQKEFAIA